MLLAIRLRPGDDLADALVRAMAAARQQAGFVVAGIGSLDRAAIRPAGQASPPTVDGRCEILTLSGSIACDGAHLHISVADAKGRVRGGHVRPGCRIATTAEILLAWLPALRFARVADPVTGFAELSVRASEPGEASGSA